MKKIRAAVLGYGRSGSTMHAGAIEGCNAFEMAAVCDIDPQRRAQAAERFGCPAYEDYHEMLRSEHLDLVCVITRSDQHAGMACDCLDAGVDVLVTKPWAADAAQAEGMVAAAARSGRKLLPWLPARWGCDLRRLQELVRDGAVGRPFLVRRVVSSFATRNDWQTLRRHAGGYLLNWGAHIVDPPRVLLGSPVKSVYGCMRQLINPGDAEDLFLAVMTLADGALVQAEYTISVEEMPTWVVQGDGGTITVHGMDLRVHRSTPQQPGDPTQFATMQSEGAAVLEERLHGNPYGDEHEIYPQLARALRGEIAPPVSTADALELSRVFDAIRTSSEENRVVTL
ncbi:MAG: Gfo/Idh/MocA family oxidoreductase [Gemmatimonadota bacterium]